jgi:hypothetical protein
MIQMHMTHNQAHVYFDENDDNDDDNFASETLKLAMK